MKVCFFAPTAYAYFNPDASTWAGGAEFQQVLLARHMVSRGIDVSFIVGDYGQPDIEVAERITLIKSFALFRGNRKLRFIPDMRKIAHAVSVADADVYNQRSTSFYTGQLAWFVSRLGKRFTFSVGIDYNAYPDCRGMVPRPIAHLYRYGIRKADAVIAQTEKQRRLMEANFNREIALIRNGIPIPSHPPDQPVGGYADAPPEFIWIGSLRRRKHPERFLELARRVPDALFTIIGGQGDDDELYRALQDESARSPNTRCIGFVPPAEIERYYRRAYALVNTSSLEGFPNTYLHAWVYGVPTLTIEIDPDDIISTNGLGAVTGSFEGLVDATRRLAADRALRAAMSERAARYVRKHHDIRDRGDDYLGLFERLAARTSS